MRVLFIHYGLFDSNSGIQAFQFANRLADLGWDVTLACDGDPGRLERVGEPDFECIGHASLPSKLAQWSQLPQDSLICAWTPRENVRLQTLRFTRELEIPYVVHLEDNEEHLLSASLQRSIENLRALPLETQDRLTPPDLAHPTRYLEFLRDAAGVTVITEELNEFNLADRPHRVVRPGVDIEKFSGDVEPATRRELLGLGPDDFVLVYPGTTHYANQHEMLSLYLAVKLLQRDRLKVKLVQIGSTVRGGVDPRTARALTEGSIELGVVPWREIPGYLALADAFVQPGAPDDFNRYRLPSKLPEFLAMGRPVILPHCNVGNELAHGENAMLLEVGGALEVAARLRELIADPELARRLGRGARGFAEANLSWAKNSSGLSDFYRELISAHGRTTGAGGPVADDGAIAG